MPHFNRLFNGMMKLNEIVCFHCPNGFFFTLKPTFLPCDFNAPTGEDTTCARDGTELH